MDSWTFVDAYFIDEQRTQVRSYWSDRNNIENPHDVFEYIIEVNEDDESWQHLMTVTTYDQLNASTSRYISDSQTELKKAIVEIAEEKGWIYQLDSSTKSALHKELVAFLFDDEEEDQKDKLFFLKIELFEKDFVKKCKDKDLKRKLRKSASVTEAIATAIEMQNLKS